MAIQKSSAGRSAGSSAAAAAGASSSTPAAAPPPPTPRKDNKRNTEDDDHDGVSDGMDEEHNATDSSDDKAVVRGKKRARVASPPPQPPATSSTYTPASVRIVSSTFSDGWQAFVFDESAANFKTDKPAVIRAPLIAPAEHAALAPGPAGLDPDTLSHIFTFVSLDELKVAVCAHRDWLAASTRMKARDETVRTACVGILKSPLRRHVRSLELFATQASSLKGQRLPLSDPADPAQPLTPRARSTLDKIFLRYTSVFVEEAPGSHRMAMTKSDVHLYLRACGYTTDDEHLTAIFAMGTDPQHLTIDGFCEWQRRRLLAGRHASVWHDFHVHGFDGGLLQVERSSATDLLQRLHTAMPQLEAHLARRRDAADSGDYAGPAAA